MMLLLILKDGSQQETEHVFKGAAPSLYITIPFALVDTKSAETLKKKPKFQEKKFKLRPRLVGTPGPVIYEEI